MSYLFQIFVMLLDTVCSLFGIALLTRFTLQVMRVPFGNPVGHFVITMTDWMVRPVRRAIPGLFGFDMASLLLAWLWQAAFLWLLTNLSAATGFVAGPGVLLAALLAVIETVKLELYLLMGAVLVSVLFSWINPYAPMAGLFNAISRPLLRPFSRIIPPIGGIDLSPLLFFFLLQALLVVLSLLRRDLALMLA